MSESHPYVKLSGTAYCADRDCNQPEFAQIHRVDPLQALYDDPDVVIAMDVLKRHGITGAQYEQWVRNL